MKNRPTYFFSPYIAPHGSSTMIELGSNIVEGADLVAESLLQPEPLVGHPEAQASEEGPGSSRRPGQVGSEDSNPSHWWTFHALRSRAEGVEVMCLSLGSARVVRSHQLRGSWRPPGGWLGLEVPRK